MNMKIILACLAIAHIAHSADFTESPRKHVVLISPDFITTPKDTNSMLANWRDTPSLLWNVGLFKLTKLAGNGAAIHKRGEEIAKETPGAACTIRKLFGEELQEKYGEFKEPALKALITSAVQPTKKPQAFDVLKELKKAGHYIFCATAHDAEEHLAFRDHLRDYQKECFSEAIDGVITLPHYQADVTPGLSFYHHPNHTNKNMWFVVSRKTENNYLEAFEKFIEAVAMQSAPIVILESEKPTDSVLKIFDGKQKTKIVRDDIDAVRQHLRFIDLLPKVTV